MKFLNYLSEADYGLDKRTFVRVGPVSGQKQTHKGVKEAPARRGYWALPIRFAADLNFYGARWLEIKGENEPLDPITLSWFKDNNKNILDAEREFAKKKKKKFKEEYSKIVLDFTDEIWCHFPPVGTVYNDYWYKCSVRDYLDRAAKWYIKTTDPELYEIFIED